MRQKSGSFEKAINALKILNFVGFKEVGVAFTPTSFNVEEICKTYELCNHIGITEFRIQPLMLLGRGRKNITEIMASPRQYRDLVRNINFLSYKIHKIKIQWGDPVDHLIRYKSVAKHLYAFLVVQSNGDIVPSPYLPVTVGNIRRSSILKYWNKGLPKIWESPVIQQYAEQIKSISDFAKDFKNHPTVWEDENIQLDLIKNRKQLFKYGV